MSDCIDIGTRPRAVLPTGAVLAAIAAFAFGYIIGTAPPPEIPAGTKTAIPTHDWHGNVMRSGR